MAEVVSQAGRWFSHRSLAEYKNPNLAAALDYAGRGFRIVPLWPMHNGRCTCAKSASCKSAGKHPHVIGWKDGEATTDPRKLRRWWKRWPDAGVGAVLDGETFLLEVDPRNGGAESFAELEREANELPKTQAHRSGGGGLHFFLRAAVHVEFSGAMMRGIDIKGRGGLAVLPPSQHKSGNRYSIEHDAEVADAPAWLLERIAAAEHERTARHRDGCFSQGAGAQKTRALIGSKTDGFSTLFSEEEKNQTRSLVPEGQRREVLLSELGREWNRATFSEADAFDYAENFARTKCETGSDPFTIDEAHAIAKFITGTPKKNPAALALEVMTDNRRELAKLMALAESIDWRAIAAKWATNRRGNSLTRPADISRTANTLRHVYTRALTLAFAQNTLTPALPARELAERGRNDKNTVSARLRTLRLAGLLRVSEFWDRRTRANWTTANKAMANTYNLTPAAEAAKVCTKHTAPPKGAGGLAFCTSGANFPAWLLGVRALGPNAPLALAMLEAGELRSGRELVQARVVSSDATASRLLAKLAQYGLAERLGKRGWKRGPVALTDLTEHSDERLAKARRAAENQRRAHDAERRGMQWSGRLAVVIGEKRPKAPKLTLEPGRPGNGFARASRSDEREAPRPAAWGERRTSRPTRTTATKCNPPDERAETVEV